ncbi:hypothetical protein L3X38_018292 [Prunus dulcis]|uniref:Myb/SANT-like domain-containing protein n=1 Tax=Prunus dulcis TaxID=3755 RepID=A0AAD4W8S3_PRUDU|nr:hypothetical protein L3X38_018292 [Prunus dulcis]
MEESQRGNDKGKSKVSGGYKLWTLEESNELLQLMVNAANRGWRDSNGMLSKQTVEKKILPALNAKLGCERNHSQYLSRLKWFKQRYNIFSGLMRHSSGFGWDPITKKFTASDEVWKDYIKSHPAHVNFQTDTFVDYELHNFLRRECRSDEFPIELENESSSSSPLPGNEGDNVEQVFETQEQQRENANEWRVGIASDMWRNAMQDNNGTQR